MSLDVRVNLYRYGLTRFTISILIKTRLKMDLNLKPKYRRADYTEPFSFHEPPTTSCQEMVGLRTNDTSTDVGYPNETYAFIKKLTDGSASTIHMGKNVETGQKVIIKMISKRDEWRQELGILKELSDSDTGRLLKYVDYFESQRSSYIVTEFYDGSDLFEHIDINVPYSEKDAYKLMLEMCMCLKECHDKGVVHLDLKAENFMVKKDHLFENGKIETGNVVLIDFGHAEKTREDESIEDLRIGYNYGTVFYICPEGYQKVFSSKSDIWSLGILFSLLLTGDYPFVGNEQEYMWNSMQHNINLSKPVSQRSNLILDICLNVDPTKRPSLDQLIKSLEGGLK